MAKWVVKRVRGLINGLVVSPFGVDHHCEVIIRLTWRGKGVGNEQWGTLGYAELFFGMVGLLARGVARVLPTAHLILQNF